MFQIINHPTVNPFFDQLIYPPVSKHTYPLTDPAVNPSIIYFWATENSSIVGINAITVPAAISPHFMSYFKIKAFNPTGIVFYLSLSINMIAINNSFQELIKANINVAAIPGFITGMIIFLSAAP